MTIRQAGIRDLPGVLDIARQVLGDKVSYLQRQLELGNIFVAEQREALLGLIVWNREFFSLPFAWLVVVSQDHRRRGVASRLFNFIEERCRGSRLYSSTNKSNSMMQCFFEKRGYQYAGEVDVDPGNREVFYVIHL